ncbi:hypothetical protein [Carnobacterium divergens]|nr:hypothetical protein [Carnobacterium divergens]
MEEFKNRITELALEISTLLEEYGNPHTKIEITIDKIKQTSDDWSQPTDE